MRTPFFVGGLIVVLAATTLAGPPEREPRRQVTVMTRNVYIGADPEIAALSAAASAGQLAQVPALAAAVYGAIAGRNFPARAAMIAGEIAATAPDVIAVQEVALVRRQCPSGAGAATQVDLDYLQILLDALAARGLDYEPLASLETLDAEVPAALPNVGLCDVRLTDRDAVLVKADMRLRLFNVQTGLFQASVPGPITLKRGWISADARLQGRRFRFVATHLQPSSPLVPAFQAVQEAQAAELIAGPLATDLPVILAGSIHSSPSGPDYDTASYEALVATGLTDLWPSNSASLTCCHDPYLAAPVPFPVTPSRIDLIMTRGAFSVLARGMTGGQPSDYNNRWASDHGGVAVRLGIGN